MTIAETIINILIFLPFALAANLAYASLFLGPPILYGTISRRLRTRRHVRKEIKRIIEESAQHFR